MFNPADTCLSGIRFDDGFCSPRGELDSQPGDEWARGCRAKVAGFVGRDPGHFTVEDVDQEVSGCGESSVRKIVKQMEKMGAVEGWWERKGIDKTGRRLFELRAPGMDLADWVAYRERGGVEQWEGPGDAEFDPAGFGEPEAPAWDERSGLVPGVTYEVIPSENPDWQPVLVIARHPDELYPIGIAEVYHSGAAVWDERSFSGLGPEQYAPLGCVRVHPGYRRLGIATELIQRAATVAQDLGVPLASSDARTPEMAKFWAKQVKKGRAKAKRHRSKKHPEAKRYMLGYPPPASLANPSAKVAACPVCGWDTEWSRVEATPAGTVVVYRCANGHEFTLEEPAHPPEFFQPNPYQEWWREITPGVEGAGPEAESSMNPSNVERARRIAAQLSSVAPDWAEDVEGIVRWHADGSYDAGLIDATASAISERIQLGTLQVEPLQNPCWPCLLL